MSGVWFSTTTLYSLHNSSSNKSKALFQPLHVSVYTIMTWCPKDWLAYIHTHTYRLFFLIKHYKLTSNPWLEPVQALCMLPLGQFSLADSQWIYQLHSPGRPHARGQQIQWYFWELWFWFFCLFFLLAICFFCLIFSFCSVFCVCFLFIFFCFYFLLREGERMRTLCWMGRQECSGRSSKREKHNQNILRTFLFGKLWPEA